MKDQARITLNTQALRDRGLDGLVCSLPSNVLLLSGYFPVVGSSIAVANAEKTALLAPKDEQDLAAESWADEVRTFKGASLEWIKTTLEAIEPPLGDLLLSTGLIRGKIGYEAGDYVQPSSYAAMNVFGAAIADLLKRCAPQAQLVPADEAVDELRLTKTPMEMSCIREACAVAGRAFTEGFGHIGPGRKEPEIAAAFREPMMIPQNGRRAEGFTYCMSGPNAAEAYRAFQLTRDRELQSGDLVIIHCNSHVGGYWTDITRTYCLGRPVGLQRRMYEAVFAARQAALDAIRPGVPARDVDLAARKVMESHGFGRQFLHPTGHGVGFAAINHNAKPRLHPKSPDILQPGMVFNVEPGIYFEGKCGMRHCDMVAVTESGHDLLTPFQCDAAALCRE